MTNRIGPTGASALLAGLLGGCAVGTHTPTLPVFGSLFPVWLLAGALGVVATVVLRLVFVRSGMDDYLPVPALVYLSAAILFSIGIWALWSGALDW